MLFARTPKMLCICTVSLLFFSCSQNTSNKNVLALANSSLTKTNASIQRDNADIIHALETKNADERTHYKAAVWLPKALKADSITQNLLRYIDSLKTSISKPSNKETERNSVDKLFSANQQGSRLYHQMQNYTLDLLTLDERMQEVSASLVVIKDTFANGEQFNVQTFSSLTQQDAEAVLTSFQSSVLQIEETCLRFCLDQISAPEGYTSFEAIVGQNAKILKAGDVLEITTGMGVFSHRQLPTITIGGKSIPLNEKGFVQYRFKTSKKLGNYSLPVTVGFKDQDGNWQTRTMQVEYTLVDTVRKL